MSIPALYTIEDVLAYEAEKARIRHEAGKNNRNHVPTSWKITMRQALWLYDNGRMGEVHPLYRAYVESWLTEMAPANRYEDKGRSPSRPWQPPEADLRSGIGYSGLKWRLMHHDKTRIPPF